MVGATIPNPWKGFGEGARADDAKAERIGAEGAVPKSWKDHIVTTTGYVCDPKVDQTLVDFDNKFCNRYPSTSKIRNSMKELVVSVTKSGYCSKFHTRSKTCN